MKWILKFGTVVVTPLVTYLGYTHIPADMIATIEALLDIPLGWYLIALNALAAVAIIRWPLRSERESITIMVGNFRLRGLLSLIDQVMQAKERDLSHPNAVNFTQHFAAHDLGKKLDKLGIPHQNLHARRRDDSEDELRNVEEALRFLTGLRVHCAKRDLKGARAVLSKIKSSE